MIFLTCFFIQSACCQDTARHDDNLMKSQEQQMASWGSQVHVNSRLLPTYFEKEETKGSPYLSPNWMRGVLELSDHRRIPQRNEYMFFNYDKYNLRMILLDGENRISTYPVDSISGFVLMDSGKIYAFEKLAAIGEDFLLEPVLKSGKGYSLYKRLITRMIPANYISLGYSSEGEKFDEYMDDYEYYLVYPDRITVKKFYLKEKPVRRIFKEISIEPGDFFSPDNLPITEQNFVAIIETVNKTLPGK